MIQENKIIHMNMIGMFAYVILIKIFSPAGEDAQYTIIVGLVLIAVQTLVNLGIAATLHLQKKENKKPFLMSAMLLVVVGAPMCLMFAMQD